MILPLALLSCSKDETPAPAEGGRAISFTTEVNAADTRAAVLNLDGLKEKGFHVNAYYTGTDDWHVDARGELFMDNQHVEWNNPNWTYAPVKYWPGKLSFFAWSEGAGANHIDGSPALAFILGVEGQPWQPWLAYGIPDAATDQHDLVADVLWNETGGPVAFTFRHLLSRIGFTASPKEEGITVTSLKVRYTPDAVASIGVYSFGAEDHAEGTWEVSNRFMAGEEVLPPDTYLMLIPQPIPPGAIKVLVSWTVGGENQTRTLSLPAQVWRPGKCYTYNIKVSPTEAALDPVAEDPWDTTVQYAPCTITYYANNGTDDCIERPWTTNVAYALAGADMFAPQLEGQTFIGWNTAANGSGDNYAPGEPFITGGDAELYAQWKWEGSNCYMFVPGQSVTFPVARAYTHDGSAFTNTLQIGGEYNGEFEAAVLWADVAGISAEVVGSGINAKVTVQTAGTTPGNAVVAIKKGDDIVWSYHIWVTDYVPDATNTFPYNDFVFMDRNLGATANDFSEEAYGLYYQWGRKDPFHGGTIATEKSTAETGTIPYSIMHPNVFLKGATNWLATRNDALWGHGSTKTVYDPCPAGWRVPANKNQPADEAGSPWYGFTTANGSMSDNGVTWGDNADYPAAGYINELGYVFAVAERVRVWAASGYYENAGYLYVQPKAPVLLMVGATNIRVRGLSVRCVRDQ
jgi:hypothetical protein